MTIEDLMQYGYIELRYIIEWARKVPGQFVGEGRPQGGRGFREWGEGRLH